MKVRELIKVKDLMETLGKMNPEHGVLLNTYTKKETKLYYISLAREDRTFKKRKEEEEDFVMIDLIEIEHTL